MSRAWDLKLGVRKQPARSKVGKGKLGLEAQTRDWKPRNIPVARSVSQ